MHVLVIDDEPELTELCRLTLETAGHRVTVAHDGAAGLVLACRERPDVVLLDFMMPGIDGLGVLERLREEAGAPGQADHPARSAGAGGIPVVMFSAKGRRGDAVRGLAAGATAYVTKPFEIDRLERLLVTVAGESSAERDLRRTRALAALTAERSSRSV